MPQLNDDQTRELNRTDKLTQYLDIDANNLIWTPYTPFKNKVVTLKANRDALLLIVPRKEQTGTGITLSKEQLKHNFSLVVGDIFEKTKEYAIETNNDNLFAQVNFSASDILDIKDTEILPFANNFNTNIFTATLMADVVFITYEVTAVNISDAVAVATAFNGKIGQAKSVEISSDTANTDINDIVTLIRQNIASVVRLSAHFRTSNNTFFKGVNTASHRDDIGVHHTGANITITLHGVGIKDGVATIGEKSETSDIIGSCKPIYCIPGNTEIIVNLPGQPEKRLIHHFIRGHMDRITFDF